jgi:hypothetical protein
VEHEIECSFRTIKCLFCSKGILFQDLETHMLSNHPKCISGKWALYPVIGENAHLAIKSWVETDEEGRNIRCRAKTITPCYKEMHY